MQIVNFKEFFSFFNNNKFVDRVNKNIDYKETKKLRIKGYSL